MLDMFNFLEGGDDGRRLSQKTDGLHTEEGIHYTDNIV